MKAHDQAQSWAGFQSANRFCRAIREFDSTSIPEEEFFALLGEAAFAPSSGNLQPYELHWIKDPTLKARIAQACNGQKAAASATDLVVVVASPALGKQTAIAQPEHVEASCTLKPKSKVYRRSQIGKFQKILGVGSSAFWSPLLYIAALIRPTLSLLPVGSTGSRHWAARNAIFAAQTLMLGASAKGIGSCPMEGFSAQKIAAILNLPRASVFPIVIAFGYRSDGARIEECWRRPIKDLIISH
ncbi:MULTISPECIES: nitroreductase family protein [unclassified Pseudomonas]|uniref:nitroreductase family protein n=1 Tax=unclassified Pseudomonas TaxID=196821 RepID=UPI002AC98354|nr:MULTISPECIES: nitroreductase family protein [unclassified Pseudomonas]MEB0047423.1 nitroreductase family protein [Pseudomonas sp. Dout3]MEB0098459.1 nitroreductase family protein [Pseudomonas sp. DC1.2]WPX60726.1 nitroreductase family protein [Pseudomonas sp. DC1.2]